MWSSDDLVEGVFNAMRKRGFKDPKKKIEFMDREFARRINRMIRSFPDLTKIGPFHRELLEIRYPVDDVRRALGRLRALTVVLGHIRDHALYSEDVRAYMGRVKHLFRKNRELLDYLAEVKRYMNSLPRVKPMDTVVIAGAPNVGKSTLFNCLCGKNVKTASYPFTTTRIHIGYFDSVQVLDTPGLLDREKYGPTERQTVAALNHLASLVLFVVDPTQHAGIPLETQRKIYDRLREILKVPFLVVFNKKDLCSEEEYRRAREYFEEDAFISAKEGCGEVRNLILFTLRST